MKTPILILAASIASLGSLSAQNFESVAPKNLPLPPGTHGATPPPPPEAGSANRSILVKNLRGLVLVDAQEKVRAKVAGVNGLKLDGVAPPDPGELESAVAPFLGQPVSLASINDLTRVIVRFYRDHDRPVVDVVVPEQEITTGVLQLVVIESRLGQVRTEGNRWFSDRLLKSEFRFQLGVPISAKAVESNLAWLNKNPFRDINAIYTPGSAFGTTDIVLETKDRFPFRAFAGYENSGNEVLGENRWYVGANWGNVFGLDHQVSYQFTGSDDVRGLAAHAVTYVAPLPWHHTLTVFGSYASTEADLKSTGAPFTTGGHSEQLSARYTIPLPPAGPVVQDVFVGFDFKRTNNDLEFGGTDVFKSATDIFQWSLGYEASARDAFGTTRLGLTFFASPGRLDGKNTDAAFQDSRAGADSQYLYGRAVIERVNRLPKDFSLALRVTGQWSGANLLASEQLSEGGYDTVRGYEEDIVRGDSGMLFSAELRSPPISLCDLFGWRRQTSGALSDKDAKNVSTPESTPYDQLQLLAFFDYGFAEIHSPAPGEDREEPLSSIGLGLRYDINPYVAVRFDYGWQLIEPNFAEPFHSHGHVGVLVSF